MVIIKSRHDRRPTDLGSSGRRLCECVGPLGTGPTAAAGMGPGVPVPHAGSAGPESESRPARAAARPGHAGAVLTWTRPRSARVTARPAESR